MAVAESRNCHLSSPGQRRREHTDWRTTTPTPNNSVVAAPAHKRMRIVTTPDSRLCSPFLSSPFLLQYLSSESIPLFHPAHQSSLPSTAISHRANHDQPLQSRMWVCPVPPTPPCFSPPPCRPLTGSPDALKTHRRDQFIGKFAVIRTRDQSPVFHPPPGLAARFR